MGEYSSSSMNGAVVPGCTITPCCVTSEGNCELAWPLRICARIWSVLMSVPSWKSTYSVMPPPELALSEYM